MPTYFQKINMAAYVFLYNEENFKRGVLGKCLEMICSSFVYFTKSARVRNG
jgi:hypothetical protein